MSQMIRTEHEVVTRYQAMRVQGREEVETDEYLRQMSDGGEVEDYTAIDHTAKSYLGYMVRNITRRRWLQVRQALRQYVAWKWMLGHEDADTFPGASDPQRHDLRLTYIYLRDQIQSGEWDRLTEKALQQAQRQRQRQQQERHQAHERYDTADDKHLGASSTYEVGPADVGQNTQAPSAC